MESAGLRDGTGPTRAIRRAPGPGICILATALLVLSSGPPVRAATWLVRPDGTGDVSTIPAALNIAADGDEVVLANGTFRGAGNVNLNPLGKAVHLRSESGVPSDCVIDCEHDGRGLTFDHGETRSTIVDGTTITNAQAESWFGGAGAYCTASSPILRNCRFDGCWSLVGGALALWYGSHPLLRPAASTGPDG